MSTTPTALRDERTLRGLAAEGATALRAALDAEGRVPAAGEASTEEAIRWVAEHFDPAKVAVACSMADAVLPALVAEHLPGVDVLFLETGYHFPETIGTRDAVAHMLDITVVDVLPELTVAEQDATIGTDLFATDPARCCAIRKMDPLKQALSGYEVWFTGVRRDESWTRTNAPMVAFDETHGLVKVNPMVRWSLDDLLGWSQEHGVPVNPLMSEGYPSIGCAPCTRPVAPGEDPRAGRWAGKDKTECGIHL
ncbi:phosphoadenosine phosphosulfate reductase [Kocuria flava]|uniref:Adenosine 5'-phosphosulfate reductase n=1 Tax=Kocuria flava TaxID=446860 RepID=A0A2N4T0P4_9MICC|nr:phosphoadenylyl-sulfate reductase [Kocuria flava]PLC11794.1 phosphoadenosine phosphosulfate reductase [Kocuria flava]